ncbi:MAG: hypothetical protein GY762_02350, partial [Proteobacteria bacterium]|nr:hypothetical protein [Pseudomonadota bacterium]
DNINELLIDIDKFFIPKIELTVYENPKWVPDQEIHLSAKVQDENHFKQNEFDIVIDHSILRRSNTYKEFDYLKDNIINKIGYWLENMGW